MKFNATPRLFSLALALSAGFFLQSSASAQAASNASGAMDKPAGEVVNKQADGTAVKGYDVVSYFQDKKAVKGKPEFSYQYQGATYDFASAEHRDTFKQSPEAYKPQYGGYCAFGTSKGHKADIDPNSWVIVDGKLYLNSSKGAQKAFDKDQQGSIKEANANWQHLK